MGSGDIDLSHLNAIVGDCDVRCSTVIGKGSPIALVLMEKYRALATKLAAMGPTVPVDTFLFGHGDPDERHQSRINGVPYRPADRPWPVDPDGRPMVFFAQFCFSDSRDHVGVLPGDVLLIFIRVTKSFLLPDVTVPWVVSHEPESLAFEWYPLGLNNLVEPGLIPFTDMVFPRCYLSRHRSVDYIDEQIAIRAIAAVVPPDEFSSNEFMQSCELRASAVFLVIRLAECLFGTPITRIRRVVDLSRASRTLLLSQNVLIPMSTCRMRFQLMNPSKTLTISAFEMGA